MDLVPDDAACALPRRHARATGCVASVLVACLSLLAHAGEPAVADRGERDQSTLAVLVSETPATVRLHVLLPDNVPPGSVEVRLNGRKVIVLASTAGGRRLRSKSLRLSEEATEEGAEADYEADGSLTITLQKAHHDGP
jgi:HSP20 family molecular chaperone IbpA